MPPTKAFPEAEGYGAQVLTGCDRNTVHAIRVTTTADNAGTPPVGSFRAAMATAAGLPANDLKVIYFTVAGLISLQSRITASNMRCLYIAGQTAPGSGIELRAAGGGGFTKDRVIHFVGANVGQIVLRYLTTSEGICNFWINSRGDIILDHISGRWSYEKVLCIGPSTDTNDIPIASSAPVRNVTVQRSLFYEALMAEPQRHPVCVQMATEPKWPQTAAQGQMWNVDFHHNLLTGTDHRNPMIVGGANVSGVDRGMRMINNVIYNWRTHATETDNFTIGDFIGNYFKRGPSTAGAGLDPRVLNIECGGNFGRTFHIAEFKDAPPDSDSRPYAGPHNYNYYAGNVSGAQPLTSANNVSGATRMVTCGGAAFDGSAYQGSPHPSVSGSTATYLATDDPSLIWYNATHGVYDPQLTDCGANCRKILIARSAPLPEADVAVTIQDAYVAYASVTADVGNNRRLACNGDWASRHASGSAIAPRGDLADQRIITETLSGSAFVGTQGIPCMLCGPAVADYTGNAGCAGPVGRVGSCQGKTWAPTGRPATVAGTQCVYTASDGIPDLWKSRYSLDPTQSYANTIGAEGWTYLEHYLNGTNPLGTPILSVTPGALQYDFLLGGVPQLQVITVNNIGALQPMSWSVSDNQTWVSSSPTSAADVGTFAVTVDITGLVVGAYGATITVEAPQASNSPILIPVSVTITDTPAAPTPLSSQGSRGVLRIRRRWGWRTHGGQ